MRRLLILGLLAWCSQASITVTTLADISGDAAAHAIATSGGATWIQFVAPSANSSVVRIGDSNISSTRGTPVAVGGGFFMPPVAISNNPSGDPKYQLSTISYREE